MGKVVMSRAFNVQNWVSYLGTPVPEVTIADCWEVTKPAPKSST